MNDSSRRCDTKIPIRQGSVIAMKKKITLNTVIVTSIGAIIWIVIAIYHCQMLANTTALALMIAFAVAWSLGALIRIAQYFKQRKQAE